MLGLITGLMLDQNQVPLAGTAAVGSYTTFSTWMFQTQRLGEERRMRGLATNVLVSLAAGIGTAALGRWWEPRCDEPMIIRRGFTGNTSRTGIAPPRRDRQRPDPLPSLPPYRERQQ